MESKNKKYYSSLTFFKYLKMLKQSNAKEIPRNSNVLDLAKVTHQFPT